MEKRKFGIDWSKTIKKINEQNTKTNNKSFTDERLYYPQLKEDGTGSAIIRFLPSNDTDFPWVLVYSHSIKGIGGWYIQNCPTSIPNRDCPVCKHNKQIWNDYTEAEARELTNGKTRKANYYANILVVKDPANPSNEGKVFLFRYGAKIQKKITEAMKPEGDVDDPIYVHDWYEGANFKLIIKRQKVGQKSMANYDSSKFEAISEIGTDEQIEKIKNSMYPLSEFISEDKFLSYETLLPKYNKVIGIDNKSSKPNNVSESKNMEEDEEESTNTSADDNVTFEGDDDKFFEDLQKDE